MSKQYGLIVPNKHKGAHVVSNMVARNSAFNEESESDDETSGKPKDFNIKQLKRQDRVLQEKAVEEDPTVYQYDEIYDDIDQKRKDSKLARKDVEKKPKYINKLMAAADRRKRENERRIERQVQKEREAEGDEFKDKEAFVTSAYRKKLEELKALEEQEQREEYLEAIGDVKKQGNLDGFYRHLYDQKVNYEDKDDKTGDIKNEIKEELPSDEEGVKETPETDEQNTKEQGHSDAETNEQSQDIRKRRYSSTGRSDEDDDAKNDSKKVQNIKKRKYRRRNDSEPENEEEEEKKMEHLPSNLDADSDFSIDSSDSDDEGDKESKLQKAKGDGSDERAPEKENKEESSKENNPTEKIAAPDDKVATLENSSEDKKPEHDKKEETEKEFKQPQEVPKKPKIDIWKKRTVGEVFDAALQRYYERKALRESGN